MTPTDPRHEEKTQGRLSQSKNRLVFLSLILMLGYFAIVLRLIDLTLFQDADLRSTPSPTAGKPLLSPLRGEILDRTGSVAATSLKMASVHADTTKIDDPVKVAKALKNILPDQRYADLLTKLSSKKPFVWIKRDITPRQQYAINALGLPALNFQEEERRIYPTGPLGSHVIGYTDLDGHGLAGIEKAFDRSLAAGQAVRLTLDLRLQHIVRRELSATVQKFKAKAAVGVVMDVQNGDILAMVSLPDFDPHHPMASKEDARFPRPTLGVFEMGSTFKLFSTAAALDSGKVSFSSSFDASEPITIGRFKISDYHAKNRVMSVPEIFMYSSNIGTARMTQSLGETALRESYQKMGFFSPVPSDMPEKGQPLYPHPWRLVDTLTTSFGHGIAVTPLHLVRAAAALVNGGYLIFPRLVDSQDPPRLAPRIVSAETSIMIRQLLGLTVAAGTGNQAKVDGYDVGGKTGTAEKNQGGRYVRNRVLSSFIGVFPIRSPKYIVLVMIDEPQPIAETHGFVTGGWTAAPTVSHIIADMAPLYGMLPTQDSGPRIVEDMSRYLKDRKEGKDLAPLGADR